MSEPEEVIDGERICAYCQGVDVCDPSYVDHDRAPGRNNYELFSLKISPGQDDDVMWPGDDPEPLFCRQCISPLLDTDYGLWCRRCGTVTCIAVHAAGIPDRVAELLAAERELSTRLYEALRTLYDGDACDCSGGPEHDDDCYQNFVESTLAAFRGARGTHE